MRLAGCPPVRRVAAGIAADTMAASSVVVVIGRAATIARAMRPAKRSSPYSRMIRARVVLVIAVDDVGSGATAAAIHPHVERSFVAIAEAALGPIELRGRDAEVEQGAGQAVDSGAGEHLGKLVEAAVHGRHPPAESVQPSPRRAQRLLVAIEPEHGQLGTAFEERFGVTAAAERGVEQGSRRHRREHGDDLIDHDRLMGELVLSHELAISALVRSATSR